MSRGSIPSKLTACKVGKNSVCLRNLLPSFGVIPMCVVTPTPTTNIHTLHPSVSSHGANDENDHTDHDGQDSDLGTQLLEIPFGL